MGRWRMDIGRRREGEGLGREGEGRDIDLVDLECIHPIMNQICREVARPPPDQTHGM